MIIDNLNENLPYVITAWQHSRINICVISSIPFLFNYFLREHDWEVFYFPLEKSNSGEKLQINIYVIIYFLPCIDVLVLMLSCIFFSIVFF